MAKKLKKGAGDLFKDLEKLLDEIFGFGEEVGDHSLTPSEKRYKDKLKAKQERIERKNRRREIKKADAERKKRIKKFWKDGYDPDPTFSIWGSGKLSHPELWRSIMDDLASKGCKVKFVEKNMTYGPHPSGGLPGEISLVPDSSITALKHEAKHFYDDLSMGFPGWEKTVYDPKVRWKMEYDAYMEEIKFLRESKEFDTAKKLLDNALKERKTIEEMFNVKL